MKRTKSYQATLKAKRYSRLLSEGFLPFEARWYAKQGWPISSPGMRRVRRFRQSEITKAQKAGITKTAIPKYITESYNARMFLTIEGDPHIEAWHKAVFWEVEKPAWKRESVAIAPMFFSKYRAARKQFSSEDAYRFSSRVPRDEFDKRMNDYRTLLQNHFLHWEALKIVTARAKPDITGKRVLQPLDLTSDGWKQAMAARANYYEARFNEYRRKRYSIARAHKLAIADIEKTYVGRVGDSRSDPTPWDFLREIYRIDSTGEKTPEEFKRLLGLQGQELAKKKMPYRVARR